MEFWRNAYRQGRAVHKKVKVGKLYKKLKKPAKLFIKVLGSLCRMFSSTAAPTPAQDNNLAFMTCILKVKASKRGWQRSVIALLKNCKGVRFQMDQNGMVEVNGIADPDKLLRKIGRSKKIELQWIQFGQCSSNLFMQETNKDPPVKEKPKHNYPLPPQTIFPPYIGYGYGYPPPPPRLFRQLPRGYNV